MLSSSTSSAYEHVQIRSPRTPIYVSTYRVSSLLRTTAPVAAASALSPCRHQPTAVAASQHRMARWLCCRCTGMQSQRSIHRSADRSRQSLVDRTGSEANFFEILTIFFLLQLPSTYEIIKTQQTTTTTTTTTRLVLMNTCRR